MLINDKENYDKVRKSISMDNLRKILNSKNYSIVKLATHSGVSTSTINSYLNGQKIPSLTTLISIANYLNTNIDFLIGRSKNPLRLEDIDKICDENINLIIQSLINLPKQKHELVFTYIKGLLDSETK